MRGPRGEGDCACRGVATSSGPPQSGRGRKDLPSEPQEGHSPATPRVQILASRPRGRVGAVRVVVICCGGPMGRPTAQPPVRTKPPHWCSDHAGFVPTLGSSQLDSALERHGPGSGVWGGQAGPPASCMPPSSPHFYSFCKQYPTTPWVPWGAPSLPPSCMAALGPTRGRTRTGSREG